MKNQGKRHSEDTEDINSKMMQNATKFKHRDKTTEYDCAVTQDAATN